MTYEAHGRAEAGDAEAGRRDVRNPHCCDAAVDYRNAAKTSNLVRHTRGELIVKMTALSLAAAAVISMAGGGAASAAELPTYESAGFPISAVQVRVLGAANVQEQSAAPTSTASLHQLKVIAPRTVATTAAAAPTRTETARSIR